MNYTLENGQQIVLNKIAYRLRPPQRGDVIVFDPPVNPQEEYIKRIIGLPGETIDIIGGVVYVHKADGTTLSLVEPYVSDPARSLYYGKAIPPDNYFVLGDNRNNSSDSRAGWTVQVDHIMGKAWLSVWPPGKWGTIKNYLIHQQ
jgi:signal peptidase I